MPEPRRPLPRRIGSFVLTLLRWLVRHLHSAYAALGLLLVLALGLMLGAVAIFAELAERVARGETQALDETIMLWIHRHETQRLDSLALQITVVGNGFVVAVITVLVAAFLWVFRYRLAVVTLLVGVVGADALQTLLKQVFQRPRPDLFVVSTPFARPVSTSFPSGHAMGAVVLYLLLTYLLVRFGGKGWFRVGIFAVGTGLVLAIGLSRVYLGVHYPSDVIAGYLIGLSWVAFCVFGTEMMQRMLKRSPRARADAGEGGQSAELSQ